jgi:SnoaL-like domain
VDIAGLQSWVDAYERAWRAPGTEMLADLFDEEAVYVPSPLAEPIVGLEAIRRFWEAERSPDEEFTMTSEPIAFEGDTGVVRVDVHYHRPEARRFVDLWIVSFGPDGRCRRFEEEFWDDVEAGLAGAETP